MGITVTVTEATGDSGTIDLISAANSPKSMSNDEGSVTERSVEELIAAKKFDLVNNEANQRAPFGIQICRTPRGST